MLILGAPQQLRGGDKDMCFSKWISLGIGGPRAIGSLLLGFMQLTFELI